MQITTSILLDPVVAEVRNNGKSHTLITLMPLFQQMKINVSGNCLSQDEKQQPPNWILYKLEQLKQIRTINLRGQTGRSHNIQIYVFVEVLEVTEV